MSGALLVSDGFVVGPVAVPAFELRRGDQLALRLPNYESSIAVAEALTRRSGGTAGVRPSGHVVWADAAIDRRGPFRRLLWPCPTATDWLKRTAHVSAGEARAALREFDFDPSWRINRMPGNFRGMLGITSAVAQSADVILFATAGCDPTGRDAVFRAVIDRMTRWGALYLSIPFWTQGRQARDHFPGAVCLDVTAVGKIDEPPPPPRIAV